MKERPILFSAPMVRAILEGRKTQTRRAIKPQPECRSFWDALHENWSGVDFKPGINCPYGQPGDRLWVREAWRATEDGYDYKAGKGPMSQAFTEIFDSILSRKWRTSIHMPRRASRILLEVTAVRVERLQDIAPPDCAAEGIFSSDIVMTDELYLHGYRSLWESIYGTGSWAANPWVWVVEFKRVQQ